MKEVFGAVCCFLFGSLLLFLANMEREKVKSLLEEGELVEATVVSVNTHFRDDDDGNTTTMYTPEFAFRDRSGHHRQVKQHFSSGGTSTYDYGERVQLLYHPDEPTLGRVNTFWQLHGVPLALGFFGGLLYLMGLGGVVGLVRVRSLVGG